jgi:ribosome-associated protein
MKQTHEAPPSRSARKREVEALQKMGERLLQLTPAQRARIPLPDELERAVNEALKIKSHGALRRQRQYIGRLMREVDVEPIRLALATLDRQHGGEVRAHQRLEQWRDRLLAEGESALDAALGEFPAAERSRLAKLVRQAVADASPRGRRDLFRYLRDLDGENG